MAVYFKSKDKKFRHVAAKFESKRLRLQFFLRSAFISLEDKNRLNLVKSTAFAKAMLVSVKSRNRCAITGRSGSIFRHFRLSRIVLKQFASKGMLSGIRKSSW